MVIPRLRGGFVKIFIPKASEKFYIPLGIVIRLIDDESLARKLVPNNHSYSHNTHVRNIRGRRTSTVSFLYDPRRRPTKKEEPRRSLRAPLARNPPTSATVCDESAVCDARV